MIIKTAKFPIILDTAFYCIREFLGLGLMLYIALQIGRLLFKEQFNPSIMFSFCLLPTINILKRIPKIIVTAITAKIEQHSKILSCKSGIFNLFEDSLELKNIENIENDSTIVGKIFNYGDVTIRTFGNEIILPNVKKPKEFIKSLKKHINNEEEKNA